MAKTAFIQRLDRLSVKSALRGSKTSFCGLLGTLILLLVLLIVYIPPTISITKGQYTTTQFYVSDVWGKKFHSTDDFKIAAVFKNKTTDKMINHTEIKDFAKTVVISVSPNYDLFAQEAHTCTADYFKNTSNPITLQECFAFPQYAQFDVFHAFGSYSYLGIDIFPKKQNNPFAGTGNLLTGFQTRMAKLQEQCYETIFFTSKLIDDKGQSYMQLNRVYSTQLDYIEELGTVWNTIQYTLKNTTMDISIFPWFQGRTQENLIWLGDHHTYRSLDPATAARNGIYTQFVTANQQVKSYRYYKKIDFLMGIVGGAMLLFFIILWVPCHYINQSLHQVQNAQMLMLQSKKKQDFALKQSDLYKANISIPLYLISNIITNRLFQSVRSNAAIVKQAQRQLDIVWLIKKIKITQRTLKKKQILERYQPRFLDIREEIPDQASSVVPAQSQQSSVNASGIQQSNNQELIESIEQNYKIKEQDFDEQQVDNKFGLNNEQLTILQQSQNIQDIYSNNMTVMAIADNTDQTNFLSQLEQQDRWIGAKRNRKIGKLKFIFYKFCRFIQYFDVFGVRPNLNTSPFSGSVFGFASVLLIIILTFLTVGWTLANYTTPHIQILQDFEPVDNFMHEYVSGRSLKIAACFSYKRFMVGRERYAEFQFFKEGPKGRQYLKAVQLTSQDYDEFDMNQDTTPVDLRACFGLQADNQISMGQIQDDQYYFGFRVQPYCSNTPAYCQTNRQFNNDRFLLLMNVSTAYAFLPNNRYDAQRNKLISNLVLSNLNMNARYMVNTTSTQQTIYVDHVQLIDDTKNFFVRQQPTIRQQGIGSNANNPEAIIRNIPTNGADPYYQVKIKPTSMTIQYRLQTPKADVILGMIGGVFVIWYAIIHCCAKAYNHFNIRAQLACQLYDQDINQMNPIKKAIGLLPLPTCLMCGSLKQDILKLRQVDKKIQNIISYLWLVKSTDICYRLSSALFQRIQQRSLSQIFVKQKLDQAMQVPDENINMDEQQDQDERFGQTALYNTTAQSFNRKRGTRHQINQSQQHLQEEMQNQKNMSKMEQKQLQAQDIIDDGYFTKNKQYFKDNYFSGHPKNTIPPLIDLFEYQPSLTFRGKRQVTSCVGGLCCIIMLILVIIVGALEVSVYLDRDDTRMGFQTSLMQPLGSQEKGGFNNQIRLRSGSNFRLGVTFSKDYQDYPHDVSEYVNRGLGISLFKTKIDRTGGVIRQTKQQYPLYSCSSDYLTSWLSPLVDPAYYANTNLGYCIPDGLDLLIDGLPQDKLSHSFTLAIFNKNGTNDNVRLFLQNYLPIYHFSAPNHNIKNKKIQYQIMSIVFQPFNITIPVQQNITLSKMRIVYDDKIVFQGQKQILQTYKVNRFRQKEANVYAIRGQTYYYNLTFDNSFLVQTYTLRGDKFYQTFGIIGGLVAFFIFGFATCIRSFDNYKMKYLVGRQLYLFDIRKKKQARNRARGKAKKTQEQIKELSEANNLNEAQIFLTYLLSFIGFLQNYTLTATLRRVTILQQFVQNDLSIYQIYKNIFSFQDALNTHFKSQQKFGQKITDIFPKHIFNSDPAITNLQGAQFKKLKGYAHKHNWTSFQIFAVYQALQAHVNLKTVFDNVFLEREFDVSNHGSAAFFLSQLGGTIGSIGTNSVGESMSKEDQREQRQRQRQRQ